MSWDSLFTESLKRRRGFPYGSCCRLLMARKVGHGDLAQSRRALSPSDGITVDRYGAALLVTAYEPGHDPLRYAAQAPEGVTSLYYQPRYESGARKAPRLLWGPSVGPQVLTEGRLRFQVDLERGMNPGVFLDTRPLRALLQEGLLQGKRVLNLFSYTSTMGAAALLGGARGVTNVDSSGSALQRGQANYDLCGLRPSGRDFVKKDVFKKLTWYAKRGTSFDAVICDPPPVIPGKGKDLGLLLGLVERIRPVLERGGALLMVSRAVEVSRAELLARLSVTGRYVEPDLDLRPVQGAPEDRLKFLLANM